MAAKKPTKPKKFKQARSTAKADAKKVFKGKAQARLKDPTVKLSADDENVLRDMRSEARKGYITDERGNKIKTDVTDYERDRYYREGEGARQKFRQEMANEYGEYGKTKAESATPEKPKAKTVKKSVTKKAAAKPAVKKASTKKSSIYADYADDTKKIKPNTSGQKNLRFDDEAKVTEKNSKKSTVKQMTRAERSAANKAKWAKMTPAERKAWSSSKTAAPTRDDRGLTERQSKALDRKMAKTDRKMAKLRAADPEKFAARERVATNPRLTSMQKAEALQKIGATTKPKPAEAPKPGKYLKPKTKAVAKTTPKYVQSTRVNAPSTAVATRPKTTVADTRTKTTAVTDKAKAGKSKIAKYAKGAGVLAVGAEAVSLVKGSTAKDAQEINKLRAKLAAMQGKKADNALGRFKEGAGSEVSQLASLATMGLVGKTRRQRMDELNAKIAKEQAKLDKKYAAQKAGTKKLEKDYKAGKYGAAAAAAVKGTKASAATGAGGSTTRVYKVEQGDTLSGIAKKAGVSLSELKAVNPKAFSQKYIYRNTSVKIPAKGKVPNPMYTGPVPYRPGSKAAKAYEASRKK